MAERSPPTPEELAKVQELQLQARRAEIRSRPVNAAYEIVIEEDDVLLYEEFIAAYPDDPLCRSHPRTAVSPPGRRRLAHGDSGEYAGGVWGLCRGLLRAAVTPLPPARLRAAAAAAAGRPDPRAEHPARVVIRPPTVRPPRHPAARRPAARRPGSAQGPSRHNDLAESSTKGSDLASGVAKDNDSAPGAAKDNHSALGVAKDNGSARGFAKDNDGTRGFAKDNDGARGFAKDNDSAPGLAKGDDVAPGLAKGDDLASGPAKNIGDQTTAPGPVGSAQPARAGRRR